MFLTEDIIATRNFLWNQKILLLAQEIGFLNLENTYNYITRAIFNRDYLKMYFFELKNLSSPTFFDLEIYELADMF